MDKVLEEFENTLKRYLKVNGRKILALTLAANQDKVRISALGLYRYYKGNLATRFSEILNAIYIDNNLMKTLMNKGITIRKTNDKYGYEIILSLEALYRYVRSDDETGIDD